MAWLETSDMSWRVVTNLKLILLCISPVFSTRNTALIISLNDASFQKLFGILILMIDKTPKGASAAVNAGLLIYP